MERRVNVVIRGLHDTDPEDEIEMTSIGTLVKGEDCDVVSYTEAVEDSTTTMPAMLRIYPDRIEVIRGEREEAAMLFVRHQNTYSMYQTSFGSIEMMINTDQYKLDYEEDGIRVEVRFTMYMNGKGPSYSCVKIDIRYM